MAEEKVVESTNPVVIVTGANRGIGYSICLRFIRQFFQPVPRDAFLKSAGGTPKTLPANHWLNDARTAKVTIVMVCRDVDAGHRAREKLLKSCAKETKRARTQAPQFDIVVRHLDLGNVQSVLSFIGWTKQTYTHVSHLVCNAGIAPFVGIDNARLLAQYRTNFVRAFSAPDFLVERTGETSGDGLGLVWQCNFFGHYMLVRGLQELFGAWSENMGRRARVVWMSTLCAMPEDYKAEDWQLLGTSKPYEGSKYQMQLVRNHSERSDKVVDEKRSASSLDGESEGGVHVAEGPFHLLVQPGVVATDLDKLNSKGAAGVVRGATLFMCRLFGSTNHTSNPYKGAISAVHAMLVNIPSPATSAASTYPSLQHNVKLNSKSALLHKDYVTVTECDEAWTDSEMEKARNLVEHCDKLYDMLAQESGEQNV